MKGMWSEKGQIVLNKVQEQRQVFAVSHFRGWVP